MFCLSMRGDTSMKLHDYTNETPHYWDNFWENNGGFGGGNSDPDTNCEAVKDYEK